MGAETRCKARFKGTSATGAARNNRPRLSEHRPEAVDPVRERDPRDREGWHAERVIRAGRRVVRPGGGGAEMGGEDSPSAVARAGGRAGVGGAGKGAVSTPPADARHAGLTPIFWRRASAINIDSDDFL